MATVPQTTADKHLAHQLRVQRETMEQRGIAPDLIAAEMTALERAIRTELWRIIRQSAEES